MMLFLLIFFPLFATIAGNIFYTVVEKYKDFIPLPDFPDDITDTIFLELVEHGYSKGAVIEDNFMLTSCTPIVQLYADMHNDPLLHIVHVAIQDDEPQHYTLREVPAIPDPDSPSSRLSELTVMDNDTNDPEFPPDIMDASDLEEDLSFSSEVPNDSEDEKDE